MSGGYVEGTARYSGTRRQAGDGRTAVLGAGIWVHPCEWEAAQVAFRCQAGLRIAETLRRT